MPHKYTLTVFNCQMNERDAETLQAFWMNWVM